MGARFKTLKRVGAVPRLPVAGPMALGPMVTASQWRQMRLSHSSHMAHRASAARKVNHQSAGQIHPSTVFHGILGTVVYNPAASVMQR